VFSVVAAAAVFSLLLLQAAMESNRMRGKPFNIFFIIMILEKTRSGGC
jgi:hypothetical protein